MQTNDLFKKGNTVYRKVMLKFLPAIYPDESAYSYFCRLFAHSGYSNRTVFTREVFNSESVQCDYDFIFSMSSEFRAILEKYISIEELLLKHTLFPYYARFLPKDKRIVAYQYAMSNKSNLNKMLPVAYNANDDYLRYCPECVKRDRERFGESYYHVAHLIPQVYICSYHNCALIDTDVRYHNGGRGDLKPLEFVLGNKALQQTEQYPADDVNLRVAKYLNEIVRQPFDLNTDILVGAYLNNRLDDRYFSPRGDRIRLDVLHKDLCDYYNNLKDYEIKRWRIAYMFKRRMYNYNPYDIALVAFFEGIPHVELCKFSNMKKSRIIAFDKKVRELRQQKKTVEEICNMLHVCKDTVMKILLGTYDGSENMYERIVGRKRYDWEECDEEYCRRFDEFLSSNPPEVTVKMVAIYFGEDKTLINFPKLRRMIAEYQKETHFVGGNIVKLRENYKKIHK